MPTPPPSDEIDIIAYAVSFFDAAAMVGGTGRWPNNAPMVVPFYMLIGFSIENGLKAALEHRAVPKTEKWFHSHGLTRLRELAEREGLYLTSDVVTFVDHLSPLHEKHHFRYPQNAGTTELLQPGAALELTDELLQSAFNYINGHERLEGM